MNDDIRLEDLSSVPETAESSCSNTSDYQVYEENVTLLYKDGEVRSYTFAKCNLITDSHAGLNKSRRPGVGDSALASRNQ